MIPFSDEELIHPVNKILDKIRPQLALDGGNVTFLDVKNGKVYVRLEGACIGCSSANITLKSGIEKEMRNFIHPEIEVINVAHGQEINI